MRHRVLLPRPVIDHADDPKDALAICMDRHGEVRLDVIASLLGAAGPAEARALLGDLVFHDPAEDPWSPPRCTCPAMSGRNCARPRPPPPPTPPTGPTSGPEGGDPAGQGPAEISRGSARCSSPPEEVEQFLRESPHRRLRHGHARRRKWEVSAATGRLTATIIWGTADRNALDLAENALNRGSPVEITRRRADGTTYADQEATMAARAKQAELSDRFAGWVWEDLERAAGVCRRYNDTFNGRVLRSYDDARLSLPGVNKDIDLYWWQNPAIARMIYEPTALLGHDMGLGKTLEQIIGVMEQKRLGLIRKPVFVVKNHLLEQFRDEFLWAYPQAQVMCADSPDLAGDGRRHFVARAAAENPDAIIMTQRGFETIPLTPAGHQAYLDYMEDMYQVHAESETDSVKDQETMLHEFSQRLRAYFDPEYAKGEDDEEETAAEAGKKKAKKRVEQDPAMCWEHIGADYIVTDESQDYGNLWVPSAEPGMGIGFVPPVHRHAHEAAGRPRPVRQPRRHVRLRHRRHEQDRPDLQPDGLPGSRNARRDRQTRGREDPRQDQHQRIAARLRIGQGARKSRARQASRNELDLLGLRAHELPGAASTASRSGSPAGILVALQIATRAGPIADATRSTEDRPHETPYARLHPDRAPGRHRDHRRAAGPAPAGGAVGPRGGAAARNASATSSRSPWRCTSTTASIPCCRPARRAAAGAPGWSTSCPSSISSRSITPGTPAASTRPACRRITTST